MMSSVDLNSSSSNSSSTPRTNAYNLPSRYSGLSSGAPPRSGSPAPLGYQHSYSSGSGGVPPGAEAGRLKTEQYVLEFLYKVTELVLQSRVHLPADTTRHQTASARRGWLNLAIEEVQHIRDSLGAWRDDVHIPLTLDVYWDGDPDQRVLLERWNIVYANGLSAPTDQFDAFDFHGRRQSSNIGSAKNYASGGKSRDVVQILREMMKKMAVLLRALHSFMRLLPAHRFFRQSYPSTLSYEINSCDENELAKGFDADVATSYYSFVPINTPFGFVKVSTVYRRDCTALERRRKKATKEIFQENFIIQDYVPASPEVMPASAPTEHQSPTKSAPIMMPTPTLTHRQSGGDTDDTADRYHRSSPVMAEDKLVLGQAGALRRIQQQQQQQQNTSQPMAIPHQVKSPGPVVFDGRTDAATSAFDAPATKPVPIPNHPHSYDDPARLRTIAPNPNVTAAPYGYGNVAVERSPTPTTGVGLSTSSGGFSGGGGSFQEHSPHHPLATPPRHPNSVLTPRMSGRTSFISSVSASGGKRSSNEYAYRASLENFSLDNNSPSQGAAQQTLSPSPSGSSDRAQTFHFGGRRTSSFDSQRSITPEPSGGLGTSSGGDSRHSSGTSPHLTPPFMAGVPPSSDGREAPTETDRSSTAALILRRTSLGQVSNLPVSPMLTSTPPFQANPSDLLSTSPGYSHSKHFESLRRGSTPTFTSTDGAYARAGSFHFATGTPKSGGGSILAITGATGHSAGNTVPSDSKGQAFSTDLHENSGGIWGISPDSPDKFAVSIGASTRRRFLAANESGNDDVSNTEAGVSPYGGSHLESDMLMLPFALGDDGSTATTATATSSVSERPSLGSETDSQTRTGSAAGLLAWETASVGSFLQQLKNAPRLQTFDVNSERRSSTTDSDEPEASGLTTTAGSRENEARSSEGSSTTPSFFDDELESFRNLRNELSQAL